MLASYMSTGLSPGYLASDPVPYLIKGRFLASFSFFFPLTGRLASPLAFFFLGTLGPCDFSMLLLRSGSGEPNWTVCVCWGSHPRLPFPRPGQCLERGVSDKVLLTCWQHQAPGKESQLDCWTIECLAFAELSRGHSTDQLHWLESSDGTQCLEFSWLQLLLALAGLSACLMVFWAFPL